MRFLLTNDDGFDAPGLAALYGAASALGDCTVIAPEVAQSCMGHGVSAYSTVRAATRQVEGIGAVRVLTGTPADCVRIALFEADTPVDCVIAGINHGGNLGWEVYYSGTVAAAREAVMRRCRGMAISQFYRKDRPPDWDQATRWARELIERLLHSPWPSGQFWNVNLPLAGSKASPADMRIAPLNPRPLPMDYETRSDGEAREYEYVWQYESRQIEPGSDVDLVFRGHIVATPLQLDITST